jgi:hypothetical protein
MKVESGKKKLRRGEGERLRGAEADNGKLKLGKEEVEMLRR